MATSSSSPAAAKLLARYPEAVQALARDARALIEGLLPGLEESVDTTAGLLATASDPVDLRRPGVNALITATHKAWLARVTARAAKGAKP